LREAEDSSSEWIARSTRAVALLAVASVLVIVLNQVLAGVSVAGGWRPHQGLPVMTPAGADFRDGVYLPAQQLLRGATLDSIYPPLVAVMGLIVAWLPYELAYKAQVVGLLLANLGTILLTALMVERSWGARLGVRSDYLRAWGLSVIALLSVVWVSSYAFAFSLERGNCDAYAILAAVWGVWLMIKRPDASAWLPALAIGVGTHLKLYPVLLLAIVIWKYRRNSIVPILATNAALLFVAGPADVVRFASALRSFVDVGLQVWVGNHSGASFGGLVSRVTGLPAVPLGVVLTGAAVLLLLIAWFAVFRRPYDNRGAVLAMAVSVGPMCLIPQTSHDYKLVILSVPVTVLLLLLGARYAASGSARPLSCLAFLIALVGALGRSYTLYPLYLQNKYPLILLLEVLAVAMTWSLVSEDASVGNRGRSNLPGSRWSPAGTG
jgi:hypothetical protein